MMIAADKIAIVSAATVSRLRLLSAVPPCDHSHDPRQNEKHERERYENAHQIESKWKSHNPTLPAPDTEPVTPIPRKPTRMRMSRASATTMSAPTHLSCGHAMPILARTPERRCAVSLALGMTHAHRKTLSAIAMSFVITVSVPALPKLPVSSRRDEPRVGCQRSRVSPPRPPWNSCM